MKFEFLTLDYEPCPEGEWPTRFGFTCPAGRMGPEGMCSGLLIRDPSKPRKSPTWEWDGNREKPTFRPSINCIGCSHGWITGGAWLSA